MTNEINLLKDNLQNQEDLFLEKYTILKSDLTQVNSTTSEEINSIQSKLQLIKSDLTQVNSTTFEEINSIKSILQLHTDVEKSLQKK